ncbi:MAG: hypothetical protein VX712_00855 [Bacteroidota bacterium]|uniref:Uncharacterized protein n=1 Tax=Christiangramia flava JLT2011 TaxID=1229726 RepID=A0A1L7I4Z7_9FLAO|nr:hypothetical protein [Christiangramia flava]APU68172.1 hypothetical protein GRFL_1448 [Christiangramia flava JLT2011]MAM20170.1 hypothetical protein [Christiangramia sp.]MEE2770733.1 hypothetical protein [Bacteroidota bacterium]OSS41041.1 membrane protein [Christiangramia flava JLT2011]|tara:strand:+ start:256 stop:519 length:264 start_codon:yes stop_codon:yes gene_type:complete
MRKYRDLVLILLLSVSLSFAVRGQDPPAPDTKSHTDPPCDPGTSGDGGSTGVPPPVGLCLPIDDYVYLLMAVGVMYGCYKMRNFELR